jgi:eukaryotic-like serine/threonine-protein kinase
LPGELRMRLLGALCEITVWQTELVSFVRREAEELSQAAPRGSAPWFQGMLALLMGAGGAVRTEEILSCLGELRQADIAPDAVDAMAHALAVGAYMLEMLGRRQEADTLRSQLEAIARTAGDRSPLVTIELHAVMSTRASMTDDHIGALEHARKCQELARQGGYRRFDNLAGLFVALSAWCLGAVDEAVRVLSALPLSDTQFGGATTWCYRPFIMAWLLADRGALGEAREHAEQLIALARARGLPQDEARGRWVLAEALRRAGEFEAADSEVQAAIVSLQTTSPLDVSGALATLAALRLAQGRLGEALAAAEEGIARYAAMGTCSYFCRGAFLRLVHVESLDAAGQHEAPARPSPGLGTSSSRSPRASATSLIARASWRTSLKTGARSRSRANGSATTHSSGPHPAQALHAPAPPGVDVKKVRIVQAQMAPVDITLLLRSRSRGEIWGDPMG